MLARANRIVRGDDYRTIVRRGRRSATAHVVVSVVVRPDPSTPARFGFIVSKAVGNAVVRNRTRRRLKAIAHDVLSANPAGYDAVIRALPAAAQSSWPTLFEDVSRSFERTLPSLAAQTPLETA